MKNQYRILTYSCSSCNAEEIIWNSRCGNVDETINCNHCGSGRAKIKTLPSREYSISLPEEANRVIIDMTRGMAKLRATDLYDSFAKSGLFNNTDKRSEHIRSLTHDEYDKGNQPVIVSKDFFLGRSDF